MNFNASIASNEKVQFNLNTVLQNLKKNSLHQTNKTLVDRNLNLKKNGLIWNTIHMKNSEHLNDSAVILVSVGLPTIGSLRNDDGDGDNNITKEWYHGLKDHK